MKQDFRNTKIRIKSEEHSKAIQEAVFAAGGEWQGGGEFYREGINFIFLNDSLCMSYCENAVFFQEHDYKESQFPLPFKDISTKHKEDTQMKRKVRKGHVHAELMVQYAEDAMTHAEPWKLWQVKCAAGIWHCCQDHPKWRCEIDYRRKPKTRLIHGVEIPVFDFTPKTGEEYYSVDVISPDLFEKWYKSTEDNKLAQQMTERGLIYPDTEEGKQAAILHSKAMLGIA